METGSISTSLDLFAAPVVDVGVESIRTINVLPTSGVMNDNAIEFVIPPDNSAYVDLNNTRLHLNYKVSKVDGTMFDSEKKCGFIRLFPHTLFKQIDLYMGDRCVSTSTNTYPYRAFLETALSYPSNVKNELLAATEQWGGGSLTKNAANTFESIIPLHLDMCNQGKLIVNGLPLKIRLIRNSPGFSILKDASDTNSYQIVIEKASLYVRTVEPTASLLLSHESQLSRENVVYSIDRVWVKSYTLSSGLADTTISNLFLGELPNRIFVGFVDADAFNGSETKNPFSFQHFNVNHISLLTDGKQIPQVPYEPNFEAGSYRREYLGLLQTLLGDNLKQDSVGLTLDSFINGYTIFGFTLPSVMDGPSEESVPRRKSGYINLRLRFAKALPKNITVIVYGEFDNLIQVDSARSVYTDFAS